MSITKNSCLLLLLVLIFNSYKAQTINSSFTHNGINRTYSFYVPASYTPGQPAPLVLNLHGYTSNRFQQAAYTNFNPIADTAGFIIVHPDGTLDPFTSQRFWNFGILGATVDDFSFLETLIDTIAANYTINPSRIYSVGMSNGGFMSYALACESNRFAAVGSVTGSMSVPMYGNCSPNFPTPIISIHGTADSTVPYLGNSTSKGAQEVVDFWVNNNNCNTTPVVSTIPNTNLTDNSTAEHYVYSGGTNGNTVEHFKVIGGGHTWPGGTVNTGSGNTCRDFNASEEVWRFFSQYELNTSTNISQEQKLTGLSLWPNPSLNELNISYTGLINEVSIINMQGQTVFTKQGKNIQNIDITRLQQGNYIIRISEGNYNTIKKFIVLPK